MIYFKPIHISGPTLNDTIFFIYESNKVYHKRYFRPIQISRPTLNASVCVGLQGENKIIIYIQGTNKIIINILNNNDN